MSDTPETDKLEFDQECNFEVSWEDFARNLERQRNMLLIALEELVEETYPDRMGDAFVNARIMAQRAIVSVMKVSPYVGKES